LQIWQQSHFDKPPMQIGSLNISFNYIDTRACSCMCRVHTGWHNTIGPLETVVMSNLDVLPETSLCHPTTLLVWVVTFITTIWMAVTMEPVITTCTPGLMEVPQQQWSMLCRTCHECQHIPYRVLECAKQVVDLLGPGRTSQWNVLSPPQKVKEVGQGTRRSRKHLREAKDSDWVIQTVVQVGIDFGCSTSCCYQSNTVTEAGERWGISCMSKCMFM